jgi:hypothetical protein
MAYVEWELEGLHYNNCNCDYGCPCQFNALPTYGNCHAIDVYQVDKGHFGKTPLDGLSTVTVYQWPKAIHEGDGSMQVIIDQQADQAQREALCKILHGEETEPGKTGWSLFRSTVTTVYDPIYGEIQLDIDMEARRARLVVPGLIESTGEPIRNPVTGAEHRARVELPDGFVWTIAEMASGTSRVQGKLSMTLTDSFSLFNRVHTTTHGIVR